MKKHTMISLLLALSLCGCEAITLPTPQIREQTEVQELTLAIPKGSTELFCEIARELSRRAVDFADNSLSIEIVEVEDIWEVLYEGSADLVVCENNRMTADAEDAGDLTYPQTFVKEDLSDEELLALEDSRLQGAAALFATLDYPFFFRDGECVITGGSNADVLAALNYSLPDDFVMELERLTFSGVYHWVTNDYELFEEYELEYGPEVLIAQLLDQGEPLSDPWNYVGDSDFSVREVDLTNTKADFSEKTLILSGGRLKIVDIFSNPESMEQLTAKQKAAIQEAIVYSGGYGKTLADDQQATILRQLEGEQIPMGYIDVDAWYHVFQNIYSSGKSEVNEEFADLIWDKTERFH